MKKILLLVLMACFFGIHESMAQTIITAKYVMLVQGSTDNDLTNDEQAAVTWFTTNHPGDGQVVYANRINEIALNPALNKVVWVHLDGTADNVATAQGLVDARLVDAQLHTDAITALTNYVKAGGNLYASKYATELVNKIGRVSNTYQPNLMNETADNKRGINPQIGIYSELYDHQNHPIFNGLAKENRTDAEKAHIWYPLASGTNYTGRGLKWNFNTISGLDNNPNKLVDFEVKTNSIVLGAWEHVVDYACAGLIEFLPLVGKTTNSNDDYKGRIIANGMGGYDWASEDKTDNIGKLTENILQYLGTQKLRKVAYLLPRNIDVDKSNKTAYQTEALKAVDQDDEKTALEWFISDLVNNNRGEILQPKDLADLDPTEFTTMWIHIDRDENGGALANNAGQLGQNGDGGIIGDLDYPNNYQMITRYVKNGGNLLLTKHAVQIVSPQFLNRSLVGPTTIETKSHFDSKTQSFVDHGKNSTDAWAINPVIGAAYVTSGANQYDSRYITDGKYISYFWTADNRNEPQERELKYIFDHRNNHLYYKMGNSIDQYPLNQVDGYGKAKYYVNLIEGGGTANLYKEDHNILWIFQAPKNDNYSPEWSYNFEADQEKYALKFQKDNKCDILGQWGHKSQLDNAAIVDFKPTNVSDITYSAVGTAGEGKNGNHNNWGWVDSDKNTTWAWNNDAWEGHILCIGLAAYEWQPSYSRQDGEEIWGKANHDVENAFIGEIKQLTLNALNVLENDMDDSDSKTFTVGGVTYYGTRTSSLNYATIIEVDPTLQVYDLTKEPEGSKLGNGQITDPDTGVTYNITGIGIDAFTNCPSLAYADLMAFKGVMPEDVRNRFPAWTLIYLPQEQYATSLATCPIKGENIVNTLTNDTKVSEKLKLYDNEAGNPYVYHLFANKYEFTANAVEFSRSFGAFKSTICLPFAVSADETSGFGQFYAFDKVNGDDVRFAAVSSTEAYKPYMFEPSANGTVISINAAKTIGTLDASPTFENDKYILATTLPQNWYDDAAGKGANFIGEFRPVTFAGAKSLGIYSYKPDGTFKTTTGTIYADPFRAYLKLNTPPSTAKVFRAVFEDFTPTGIFNANADEETNDGAYYTLQGIKVSNPGPGIYIHNKKKIIIKK